MLLLSARAASVTPRTASTNSEPLCTKTNLMTWFEGLPTQPESTRRMIQRLADIRKSLDPIQLSFLSEQRAQLLAPMIERSTNALEKMNLRYSLAETLTEGGNPEGALGQFG